VLLQKPLKVENVGRFTKLAATGNVTFHKVSLLYVENGYGKTTMARILRSLATFKPKLSDLENINEFGKRFMHGDSQSSGSVSQQALEALLDEPLRLQAP
jgi:wobble nucleotide-excising tRNase